MDFIDQLKQFSKRVESLKDSVQTEEATKTSIIMPFFSMLGYDVFNPQEFVPEFTADVGIKKGEKVDYAIMRDGKPAILIEAKSITENLEKHDSQLFRYFGTTTAKFAILTNGITYRFYTDLESPNKMDETPFLDLNILDIKENQVPELKKFSKSAFNIDEIFDSASELKYTNEIKKLMSSELANPSEEFIRFFLQHVYSGRATQAVIEKFRPIIKKSINQYISELMNDKIKSALDSQNENQEEKPQEPTVVDEEPSTPSKIYTTQEEMDAYLLVKNALKDVVSVNDITCKDTINYFNVLYKGNTRKWICRFVLNPSQKTLIIPDEDKNEVKFALENIYSIEQYKENLIEALKRYM